MLQRPIFIFFQKTRAFRTLFIFIILFLGAWSFKITSTSTNSLNNKVIIIDPGHGGADPGAQNSGIVEKDINLDISLRLRKYLESRQCKIIMTREVDKDFFLPGFTRGRMAKRAELNKRINIATENKADLFISIHANSFPRSNTYGMETYYYSKSESGKALAELIQGQLTQLQKDNKRKAKAGDYYLINQTKMPAVIVEVGFISNPRERKLLLSKQYRDQIAKAIGEGIEKYYLEYPLGIQDNSQPTGAQDGPRTITQNNYNLYFLNSNLDNLSTEKREFNQEMWSKLTIAQQARKILDEMLQGPHTNSSVGVLSPKTIIRSLTIENGVVTIDFDSTIKDYMQGGAIQEELTIKSIIWSMTQIPGINGVRILIDGEFGDSIGGHIILDHILTSGN